MSVRGARSRYDDCCVLIVVAHERKLDVLVVGVVLYDAEGIDPEARDAKCRCHSYRILHGLGERIVIDAFNESLVVAPQQAESRFRAPNVGQSYVTPMYPAVSKVT